MPKGYVQAQLQCKSLHLRSCEPICPIPSLSASAIMVFLDVNWTVLGPGPVSRLGEICAEVFTLQQEWGRE